MRSSSTHAFCLFWLLCIPYGHLAAADENIAGLKARVEQLEAENKALRAEVVRLKDELYKVPGGKSDEARLATDFRRLVDLDQALRKEPADSKLRQEAAELAKRLAKLQPGKFVWQVLLNTGVVKDGMSVEEAEKVLGPATGTADRHVEWYFNPDHRHVAANLTAKVTMDGLSGWKIGGR
jgi:cell division septum initiation protein DivIVA